jgi:bifunctional DNA-binding transcriptional regulator/antitoxin component of YhaV-PrlF toxin-antitoxin module
MNMNRDLVELMTQLKMEVAKDGKVEIPSEVAAAMGWQVGEKLTVQVQQGEVRIFSQNQAVRLAQNWVKSFVAEGRSLSDELIVERRQETLSE